VQHRGLAVEPMTCAPNAFRSGDGLLRLEPGGGFEGSWGIRVTERGEKAYNV
jgi:aldose 1-epimerase